jgi:hypothetical protein
MSRVTEPGPAAGAAVRLTATLPKGDGNGLRDTAKDLLNDPRTIRYAVIAYDVARIIDDLDAGTDTAAVRIQRIEPLAGKPATAAEKLLLNAATARLGDAALHFGDDDQ